MPLPPKICIKHRKHESFSYSHTFNCVYFSLLWPKKKLWIKKVTVKKITYFTAITISLTLCFTFKLHNCQKFTGCQPVAHARMAPATLQSYKCGQNLFKIAWIVLESTDIKAYKDKVQSIFTFSFYKHKLSVELPQAQFAFLSWFIVHISTTLNVFTWKEIRLNVAWFSRSMYLKVRLCYLCNGIIMKYQS